MGPERSCRGDLTARVCLAATALLGTVRKQPARAGVTCGAASAVVCTYVGGPGRAAVSLKGCWC